MLYGDYLDYWMKEYFEINYKYSTSKRYKESFSNIKKELGKYKLNTIYSKSVVIKVSGIYILFSKRMY